MVGANWVRVRCGQCGESRLRSAEELLRGLGMLRREKKVQPDMVTALLAAAQPRLACEACGHVGLQCEAATDEDDGDWPDARICERCRKPISAERLEVFPDAQFCAACQQQQQSSTGEREFCPRCGDVLRLVASRGRGVAHYVHTCSNCGYSGSR